MGKRVGGAFACLEGCCTGVVYIYTYSTEGGVVVVGARKSGEGDVTRDGGGCSFWQKTVVVYFRALGISRGRGCGRCEGWGAVAGQATGLSRGGNLI